MHRQHWKFVVMVCWLLVESPALAGLYFSTDVLPWPVPSNHNNFMLELNRLRNLALTNAPANQSTSDSSDSPARVRQAVNRLESRRKDEILTLSDRIDLSAYYVLLGNPTAAQAVLAPALEVAPNDFRVLSNLATIYHRLNDFGKATNYLDSALKNWPQLYPGWTAKRLAWYRRAEEHYLALLNGRNTEMLRRLPADTVDEVFPDVRFAERGADYLIGGDDAVRARLPQDALEIVRQLLICNPTDLRLFWLYGELLNATGDHVNAYKVLDSLVFTPGLNFPLLREHRTAHVRFSQLLPLSTQYRLFYVGIPSPLGVVVYEQGRAVLLNEIQPDTDPSPPKPPDKPRPTTPVDDTPDTTVSWLPDWRPLLVGFGAGVVVGILIVFQVRLLRRGGA